MDEEALLANNDNKDNDENKYDDNESVDAIDPNTLTPLRIKVKLYSLTQIIVSLTFWVWALINILVRDYPFDAGVISFAFSFFAGVIGWISTQNINKQQIKRSLLYANIHFGLTIFAHFLVTLNYIAGVIGAPNTGYMIYCIIFTALWAISGVLFSIIAFKWRSILKKYATYNRIDS